MTAEYAERIVRLLQSGRRCGLSFEDAWARALDVVGVKITWHRPRQRLTLFGEARSELTPLEFLHERCRREWYAAPGGPKFGLEEMLEAMNDARAESTAVHHRSTDRGRAVRVAA